MTTYTLPDLERHWAASVVSFAPELPTCQAFFEQLPKTASGVAAGISERRAYLLLVKSLNHAFATYLLLQRGLVVDAALSVRNALETLLLLELLCSRPELCEQWSQGKELRPSEVRRHLAAPPTMRTGDLIIERSESEYADATFAYAWLSRITHANLESLDHAATRVDDDRFVLHVGGARFPAQAVAISKILGVAFLRVLVTTAAVHSPQLLKSDRARFAKLKLAVAAISKAAPNTVLHPTPPASLARRSRRG